MKCGLCKGGVRGYRGVLHGRPIADWKHTDAPPGTAPHRPVLGTPVDTETLDRVHRAPREAQAVKPKPPQPVVLHDRPAATETYVDSQSITSMLKLADLEGWTVVQKLHRELTDGTEYLIFKFRRRDLGAVGIWRRTETSWLFDEGYALSQRGYRQVQSTSLKEWLKTRDEECPDCALSSYTHTPEGECP